MYYQIFLKNELNSKNEYPVYFRIGRPSKYMSLNFSVKKSNWNNNTKQVRKNDVNHLFKNSLIKAYTAKLNNMILEAVINNNTLTPEMIIKRLKNKDLHDFYDIAKRLLTKKRKVNKPSTIVGFETKLGKLKKHKGKLNIQDVNESYLNKLCSAFLDNDIARSTINNYLALISSIMKFAIKEKIINYNPVTDFSFSFSIKEMPHLEIDEIEMIEKLYYSDVLKPRVNNTLLNFLFSCETGISLMDIRTLTKNNISEIRHKNKSHFMISDDRTKSGISYRVPLTEKALKYIAIRKKQSLLKFLFRVEIDATIYLHMKKIREACPTIKTHFTFHTGRHSFGTFWISSGTSERVVMEMMGHKNSKTNRIYSKIQDYTLINETIKV